LPKKPTYYKTHTYTSPHITKQVKTTTVHDTSKLISPIIIIIIIIIIILGISFMQRIYTYIPKTNHVPKEHRVAAILMLLFMVHISLVPALTSLYLYVSTFRSMCAVPSMAVFYSSLTL
jgi:uncharacterized membrane protein YidH (DUF202 family)